MDLAVARADIKRASVGLERVFDLATDYRTEATKAASRTALLSTFGEYQDVSFFKSGKIDGISDLISDGCAESQCHAFPRDLIVLESCFGCL
jgi:hypothetical protein